jgi:hypothetical protein
MDQAAGVLAPVGAVQAVGVTAEEEAHGMITPEVGAHGVITPEMEAHGVIIPEVEAHGLIGVVVLAEVVALGAENPVSGEVDQEAGAQGEISLYVYCIILLIYLNSSELFCLVCFPALKTLNPKAEKSLNVFSICRMVNVHVFS